MLIKQRAYRSDYQSAKVSIDIHIILILDVFNLIKLYINQLLIFFIGRTNFNSE